MRTNNSLQSNYVSDYKPGGQDLLGQLEQRVNNALKANENNKGPAAVEKIDPQEILKYIAQISQGPVPGMMVQNTVV